MVWISADGRTWRRVRDQAAFHGVSLSSEVVSRGTIVAAGSISTNGVVLTSRNGTNWRQIDGQVLGGASIYDVVQAGPGFVAVGDSYPAPPPYGSHAVVWVSSDGFAWRRVARVPSVFVNGSAMSRVVSGPQGLVASGNTEPPNPDYRSLLWTSRDGLSWRLDAGDPLEHGFVNDMVAVGKRYLAVGSADSSPVLWSSADGRNWRRAVGAAVFTGDNTQLFSVTTLRGQLVVVGEQAVMPSSTRIPTVWRWTTGSTALPAASSFSKLDPKGFRLRFTDLPGGYSPAINSGTIICDLEDRPDTGGRCHHMLGLLGRYLAYFTEFDGLDGRGEITGTTILVASSAGARSVLREPGVLIQPLGAPPAVPIARAARIGQQFRMYHVRVPKPALRRGETPYWNGVAGIWRDGREVGIVEVTGTGKGAEGLAMRLTRAMHAHLHA
jgi:hypothetical protein